MSRGRTGVKNCHQEMGNVKVVNMINNCIQSKEYWMQFFKNLKVGTGFKFYYKESCSSRYVKREGEIVTKTSRGIAIKTLSGYKEYYSIYDFVSGDIKPEEYNYSII